jgi:hypothetical protein
MNLTIEIVGWLAALLILAAYGLISAGKIEARSLSYQLLNILGAAGFIVNSGWNGAIPSAALNIVWMGIGIVTLLRTRQSSRASAR